jgi:short-subunit dehydrogenase
MNILITGCSRGLGLALQKQLPHPIYCHYRERVDIISENILVGNLCEEDFPTKAVNFIEKWEIDTIICNAGVYLVGPINSIPDNEVNHIVGINLIHQIRLIKAVFSHFLERNFGRIVIVNSIAALYPTKLESIYSASKAGLSAFSKSLQIEAVGTNIQITDLYLGAMDTDMTKNRESSGTLIDVNELAAYLGEVLKPSKSFYVNQMIIRRKN